jgi:hypothetical protein
MLGDGPQEQQDGLNAETPELEGKSLANGPEGSAKLKEQPKKQPKEKSRPDFVSNKAFTRAAGQGIVLDYQQSEDLPGTSISLQYERYEWIFQNPGYTDILLALAPINVPGVQFVPREIKDRGEGFIQIEFTSKESDSQGFYYRLRWHTKTEQFLSGHSGWPSWVVERGHIDPDNGRFQAAEVLVDYGDTLKEKLTDLQERIPAEDGWKADRYREIYAVEHLQEARPGLAWMPQALKDKLNEIDTQGEPDHSEVLSTQGYAAWAHDAAAAILPPCHWTCVPVQAGFDAILKLYELEEQRISQTKKPGKLPSLTQYTRKLIEQERVLRTIEGHVGGGGAQEGRFISATPLRDRIVLLNCLRGVDSERFTALAKKVILEDYRAPARLKAARQLAAQELTPDDLFDLASKMLEDDDASVCQVGSRFFDQAAFALGDKLELDDEASLEPRLPPGDFNELLIRVADSNPSVRARAAFTLGFYGSRAETAVPNLMQLLRDPVLPVRWQAIGALGKIGPQAKESIPDLLEFAKQARGIEFKHITEALAGIGPDSLPALGELFPYARKLSSSEPYEERNFIKKRVAGMGLEVIPTICELIDGMSQGWEDLIGALNEMGPTAVPAVLLWYPQTGYADVDNALIGYVDNQPLRTATVLRNLLEKAFEGEDGYSEFGGYPHFVLSSAVTLANLVRKRDDSPEFPRFCGDPELYAHRPQACQAAVELFQRFLREESYTYLYGLAALMALKVMPVEGPEIVPEFEPLIDHLVLELHKEAGDILGDLKQGNYTGFRDMFIEALYLFERMGDSPPLPSEFIPLLEEIN